MPLLQYEEVRRRIQGGRAHLLLGNGFSIACDPIFRYASLYEQAVRDGLSARAQAIFEKLGTNNFEGVMRLLEDADWVARTYGLIQAEGSEIMDDVERVKETLVESVTASHLEHTGLVDEDRKAAARTFLSDFHNVFTTNYDLLSYWVNLSFEGQPRFKDGFRSPDAEEQTPFVVFAERLGNQKGLYYLHGGLHLYLSEGELRKHTWSRTRTRLTESIRAGLELGQYPLFVAEGTAEKKLEQIQRVGYLWYCLDKLSRVGGPVVVFGHSLGASDQHIWNALGDNTDLSVIYVGLFGDENSALNRGVKLAAESIRARRTRMEGRGQRRQQLEILYFDSNSARVWG